MSLNSLVALLLMCSVAYADATKVEVTATVLNTADYSGGVVTGTQPVQWDIDADTIIISF